MNSPVLLRIEGLSVSFDSKKVVDDISFDIRSGETFALVGESGSGKSLSALAVMRLLPSAARFVATRTELGGEDLRHYSELDFCSIRGRRIGFIFQDPMSSLNPVMSIGDQIAEVLRIHGVVKQRDIQARVIELLEQVEIPSPATRYKDYAHQLSGGQRQRVMIAMALASEPELLIADEPTTALDVTIQAQIMELLKKLQKKNRMALWLISHDLALVSNIADSIAVMQKGKIVEKGEASEFFRDARHPYSRKLLAALPDMDSCLGRSVETTKPLLKIKNLAVYYPIRKGIFQRVVDHIKAVDDVSFDIASGKTLALVGESGCGKTTLGKALVNLLPVSKGEIWFAGQSSTDLSQEELRRQRANIQIVFQDPFSSMNPRLLVGEIVSEGLKSLRPDIDDLARSERVRRLLNQVGLESDAALRYPHEFSGGQRQRICIARALAVEPRLIICDEPTSALDVSVQAQLIELLKAIQNEQGISYLLITHNVGVVAEMAHHVAVMYKGRIVEMGDVESVLKSPKSDYTRELLAAVPRLLEG